MPFSSWQPHSATLSGSPMPLRAERIGPVTLCDEIPTWPSKLWIVPISPPAFCASLMAVCTALQNWLTVPWLASAETPPRPAATAPAAAQPTPSEHADAQAPDVITDAALWMAFHQSLGEQDWAMAVAGAKSMADAARSVTRSPSAIRPPVAIGQ